MAFLRYLREMKDLPWYILTRCTILTAVILGSTLLCLVAADAGGGASRLLGLYARDCLSWAPVVLFAGLFASAFLEDILRARP